MQPKRPLPVSFFGLLITSFFLAGTGTASCPEAWVQYRDKCHTVFIEEKPWSEAEVACQRSGKNGHLASFLSAQENSLVAKFISSNHAGVRGVWIGLHDPQKKGRWKWSDLATTNFRPWKIGEPSNVSGVKSCVYMAVSEGFKKWVNEDCKVKMPFVCKMG